MHTAAPEAERQRQQVRMFEPDDSGRLPEEKDDDQARLTVQVVRADTGVPIPGCKVIVSRMEISGGRIGSEEGAYESDQRGIVEAIVPAAVPLLVLAGGARCSFEGGNLEVPEDAPMRHVEEVPPIEPGTERTLRVVLTIGRDTIFFGRVVAEDGAPIAGARIAPADRDGLRTPQEEHPLALTTSEDGLFSIPFSSWRGTAMYRIEASGYGPGIFVPGLGHEVPENALPLVLRRSAALHARTRSAEGKPLTLRLWTQSQQISVPRDAPVFDEEVEWNATLDLAGMCIVEDLPSRVPLNAALLDDEQVVLRHSGFIILEPGEMHVLELDLGHKATITGWVSDQQGTPIADAEIWLAYSLAFSNRKNGIGWFVLEHDHVVERAQSNQEGKFTFDEVPPGTWWIGPGAGPFEWDQEDGSPKGIAPEARAIEMTAARDVFIELIAARDLFLSGKVMGPDGAPAGEVLVGAFALRPPAFSTTLSERDGSFVLGPLTAEEYLISAKGSGALSESDVVQAFPGSDDIVLHLMGAGSLRGVVVEASTGRRMVADLWLLRTDIENGLIVGAGSDQDGRFEVDGLVPGTYDLAASRADGLVGILRDVLTPMGANRQELRIELVPGGRLQIQYSGPAAYAHLQIFSQSSLLLDDAIQAGTSMTHTVPSGPVRIEMTADEETQKRELTATVGSNAKVVFEFH